ncbi:MAG: alkaline phosphatase family protein [Rhodothermales bacterium]
MEGRKLLFIFVDGVGVGPDGPANPFSVASYPNLEALYGGRLLDRSDSESIAMERRSPWLLDARLGVEGLPQSGTGQASLFTGVNCAAAAGRHYGPFPHTRTYDILRTRSVFARLLKTGCRAERLAFANAYPDRFFEYARLKNRWTVTTRCAVEAGIRIRTESDLADGKALAADITGQRFPNARSIGLPITISEASDRIVALLDDHDYVLFEYFKTDKAGHSQQHELAAEALRSVDTFLGEVLSRIDLESTTLVLTSDHGNIEDLSTRSHTLNPVPLLVAGPGREQFSSAHSLLDIVGPCVACLNPT